MLKTPLSTVIGGAFWTPKAMILGGTSKTFNQLIKSLFANGEQGFVYDPNDLTTMFQDSTGTVPVTGVGQPVGLILDKSGRGNHARQTTSASRPILRQNAITKAYYLEFDGSDDFLVTNSIDFTATDKATVITTIRKIGDSGAVLAELSADSNTSTGNFLLLAPNASQSYGFRFKGLSGGSTNVTGYAPPHNAVLTAQGDLSKDFQSVSINGVKKSATITMGGGNVGNHPLYIGRRGGTALSFNGHIYSLIGIGRLTTDAETVVLEKLIAKNTGVTLSV